MRLGSVRAGSSAAALLEMLPGVPVLTVDSAATLINRSRVKTGQAINRLLEAGILVARDVGRQRYRVTCPIRWKSAGSARAALLPWPCGWPAISGTI